MNDVAFDRATGTLTAPEPVLREVLHGGAPPEGVDHPALERARAAYAAPLCVLRLERGERVGHGWVAEDAAAVLVPRADGRARLASFPPVFLTGALLQLNGLGPRPRLDPASRVSLSAGELAIAIAAKRSGHPLLQRTLDAWREHWRVEARWRPADGSPGVRAVEVLDSDAGLWLVVPDGPTVELWPTTPTQVLRMLAGLLPRDHEREEDA